MQLYLDSLFEKLARVRSWVILILLALIIKIISYYPSFVEHYYTYGLYPVISKVQRFCLGWIPFSIGDLFYGFLLVTLVVKAVQFIRLVFSGKVNRQFSIEALKQLVFLCLFIYVFFYLLWGLNYSRIGIAAQLGLKVEKYSVNQLEELTSTLENRLNEYAGLVNVEERDSFDKKKKLFRECSEAYRQVKTVYPFLSYKPKSIKPSIFSYAGNILGFQGYYNPFSGEGQVNTTVPVFIQPFVSCHEIGHQLGYAKENEANFVGYLACKNYPSNVFRYSAYFEMFSYSIGELYRLDSSRAAIYYKKLSPVVTRDYTTLEEFYSKYQNPIEPIITRIYSSYLKANNQPAGKRSYNMVVAWLIAYQKKFGKEAI